MQANHSAVFLDDDQDLREAFGDFARDVIGCECLGVGSYEELVSRREEVLKCDRAVLDVNLGAGKPSGIDAYHWLRQQGFQGRIVFLTGHASTHPLVAAAHRLGDARVVLKPATPKVLRTILAEPEAES